MRAFAPLRRRRLNGRTVWWTTFGEQATLLNSGVHSLRRLGLDIGDVASVRGAAKQRDFRIVGTVVLPEVAQDPGVNRSGPGDGAVLGPGALRDFGPMSKPVGFAVKTSQPLTERKIAEIFVPEFEAGWQCRPAPVIRDRGAP